MNQYRHSLIAFLVFLIVFQTAVIAIVGLDRPLWIDEEHFVQTIRQFGEGISPTLLKHYNEMSTPLPFILYALWGRLFGFDIHVLRILSVIIALATYLCFHRLLSMVLDNSRVVFLAAVFLVIHPYMIGFSIFVYTDMLPIFLVILAFVFVFSRNAIGFGIASACALLCRQYYVFLPLAAVLFSLAGIFPAQNRARPPAGFALKMFVASLLSPAPLGLLMLYWQGPAPQNEFSRSYLAQGLSFHPSHVTLYISLLFIYLLPIVLVYGRRLYENRVVLIISLCASFLYWSAPVGVSRIATTAGIETVGLLHRFLRSIWSIEVFAQTIFYLGFLLGLPIVLTAAKDTYQRLRNRDLTFPLFLDLCILAFLMVMPFSYLAWEKYFMPLVPLASIRILLTDYERQRGNPGAV
ncbi:MAG: hypothetical protein AB1744_04950 [Candidatus Zixiibacteriota bacterium]